MGYLLQKLAVSVIIPTYNRADFIGDAVKTVLMQTYQPAQIIIVDDGSTDKTGDILRKLGAKITYIYQSNAGPPAARNRGLHAVTSEMIAFLDSDDLWPTDKLEHQISIISSHPEIDIVLSALQYCEYSAANTLTKDMNFLSEPLIAYNLGAALIRKSAFERVGFFDTQLRHSDDWDWFVRAMECELQIAKTPQVVLYNRRHPGNLSNQREIGNRHTLQMLKKTLDRRRGRPQEKENTL